MADKDTSRVNTLIIGAGRSGTTSLSEYLRVHPDVCFSMVKEVHYFSIKELYRKGEKYYHSFFRKCEKEPVIASADTYLLMDYDAISRIYAYNPDMRFIVMLRNPVTRAYSSYNYSVNFGHHDAYSSFFDSIEAEKSIAEEKNIVTRNNLGHFYGSLYYKHLINWTSLFPREQFLLLKTVDLKESPEELSQQLFSFLNITNYQAEIERANVAAVPSSKKLEKFLLDRDLFLRKIIRNMTPRFIKNFIMRSGIVDKLHDANRKEQSITPLSKSEIERGMQYFTDDLQLLKTEFDIEF